MPDVRRRYTVAEVLRFPADGNRYELIAGELVVSPAPLPRHQLVVTWLQGRLWVYLERLGRANTLFSGPADISWDDATLVQPDLFVVPPEEVSNSWTTYKTLLLAVEVMSPSSRRHDKVDKRRIYQDRRVATYWVVDPDSEVVEIWEPHDQRPLVVSDVLSWRVTPEAQALELELHDLFRNLPR